MNEDMLKTINAYNQQMIPRNFLNQTADMFGKTPHSFKMTNPTPLNAPSNVIYRRKTPSINVNASIGSNQ